MSTRKRPARVDTEDEDDSAASSVSEDTSSLPGSDGRKRRRISRDSDTTPEQNPNLRIQDYEELEEDSESLDEEDVEQQATQAVQEKRARDKRARQSGVANAARDYGILESVVIHDFMNHHYFEFLFGPLINFITGKNGSGKSAVLTAITLCLGGKAASTNRGKGLKSFIRHGCERARIICKIKNQGSGAYQPEEYGDSISIERHFSANGTSGYVIRSASGRKVSDKRLDLDPILDHCGLQVDNPLNVLSQDNARQFLGSAKPADKYKFFIKGVQLEQLDEDYRLLEDRLFTIQQKLDKKKEDVTVLENIRNNKIRLREQARKTDGLVAKMRELRRQCAWAQVRDQEAKLVEYDVEMTKQDELIRTAQLEVDEYDTDYQDATTQHEVTKIALDEAKAAFNAAEGEKRELKVLYEEAKREAMAAQHEERAAKTTLAQKVKEKKNTEGQIAEEERRLDEVNGGGAARRREERTLAQATAQQARTELEAHKAGRQEVERNRQIKGAVVNEKAGIMNAAQRKINEIEESLGKLQNINANNQHRAFRRNNEQLERLIGQETRWQHKPLGPLGRHVKLLKPEWSSVLESMFGKTLSGFLVFSRHDLNLLSDLKRRAACDAEMFLLTDRKDFNVREPDEQFVTILKVLEIDNQDVKKHLIIQHVIDQHILVPNLDDATRTMYDSGRLRCVRGCFAFNPHDPQKGHLLRYGAGDGASQDPVLAYRGLPRMKGDIEATIAIKRIALRDAQDDLATARRAWTEARVEVVKADAAVKKWQKRLEELNIAAQEADDKVQVLDGQISNDSVEGGKLSALRDGLKEVEESRQLAEDQYKDAVIARDTKQKAMHERNQRMNAYDTTLQELQHAFNEAERQHRLADQNKANTLLTKNGKEAVLADTQKGRQELVDDKAEAEAHLQNIIAQATEKVGNRIHVPDRSTKSLFEKHEEMKKTHRQWQQRIGISVEDAERAAAEAEINCNRAEVDHKQLEETQNMLQTSLDDRRARWRLFRQFISARARVTFVALLSERGFRGELLINHAKRLLDLRVEPDITRRNAAGRSANTLSGGEKSYAQICMLLAIWEAMGSPLRCLDEFDVFMDNVNRSTSIRMILDAARQSIGRQYILISPGAKEDIPQDHDVRVQELAPPERGQQTIEESRGGRRRAGAAANGD
ncbi:Structural maintenance of chromosomes protein 6 [Lithohypha guttulata]|nr:Structural maintenance of chromosomes protein 6 [Lithohypha guttulata]